MEPADMEYAILAFLSFLVLIAWLSAAFDSVRAFVTNGFYYVLALVALSIPVAAAVVLAASLGRLLHIW